MTDQPPREARRRFYICAPDLTVDPSDFAFVNEDEAIIDGRTAGHIENPVPGYRFPFCTGVPPLRATPKVVVGHREEELLDIYGFHPRFASSRTKALLSSLDPDGFEFVECETVDGNAVPIEPYWMMNATRVVIDFDEARSSFIRYVDQNPESSDPSNPSIVVLNDIYWNDDLPDSWHVFYLSRYQASFLIDGLVADAWQRHGLTGARLTPIQSPTDQEMADHLHFINYPYWTNQGRRP